jgi:hypothetical protein
MLHVDTYDLVNDQVVVTNPEEHYAAQNIISAVKADVKGSRLVQVSELQWFFHGSDPHEWKQGRTGSVFWVLYGKIDMCSWGKPGGWVLLRMRRVHVRRGRVKIHLHPDRDMNLAMPVSSLEYQHHIEQLPTMIEETEDFESWLKKKDAEEACRLPEVELGARVMHPRRGFGHVFEICWQDPRSRPYGVRYDNEEEHRYTAEHLQRILHVAKETVS